VEPLNTLAMLEKAETKLAQPTSSNSDLPDSVHVSLPPDTVSIKQALALAIPEIESALIKRALELSGNNRTRAAKILEISHRSLLYKLKSYNCG